MGGCQDSPRLPALRRMAEQGASQPHEYPGFFIFSGLLLGLQTLIKPGNRLQGGPEADTSPLLLYLYQFDRCYYQFLSTKPARGGPGQRGQEAGHGRHQ